jgi:hypothetical protein
LRRHLNHLALRSRSPRVKHRHLDPLASRDPLRTLSSHHGPHPPAKFGGDFPVNQRLLNRSRQLPLPANFCRTPVAAHALDVS